MLDWIEEAASGWRAGIAVIIAAAIIWYAIQAILGWVDVISPAHAGERGLASVYSSREGRWTASGARMDDRAMAAAHRTLPFGTHVLVRHGSRSAVVKITDRGPWIRHRIIDLTPAAARAVGLAGLGEVTLEVLR